MTSITQCPECGTRFKVSDEQLLAHEGLVRCGRCHEVFDACKHLQDSGAGPQLSLPIEPALPDTVHGLSPPPLVHEATTLAQQVQFVEELTDEIAQEPRRKSGRLALIASLLLVFTLLAQFAYFFRIELGSNLPGLKPLLEEYCIPLNCTVTLPQMPELLVIESSDLEADPSQGNIVTLHALLHNRANYAQAYPSLELTLTSLQDQPLSRRVFHPLDYLKHGQDERQGFAANRDLDIRLRLDTTDLKPSGYRLFLFYPH